MFCGKCGAVLDDTAKVCGNCGVAVVPQVNATPVYQGNSGYVAPVVTNSIPEENRPLGAWAYFGLRILFAIPVVGFIFLIVFSCSGANINRRNFARSYWCDLIFAAIVLIIWVVLFVFLGTATRTPVYYY